MLEWHTHVKASAARDHVTAAVLQWHNNEWLMSKRLRWVSATGVGRNTATAGRLGSRKFAGTPQPRWEEGIALAEQVSQVREINHFGDARLSFSNRIREAQSFLYRMFNVGAGSSDP